MAKVYIDRLDDLDLDEDRGVYRAVTRKAVVEFGSAEIANNKSHSILHLALLELNGVGLGPMSSIMYPDGAAADSGNNPYNMLRLTGRKPRLMPNEPMKVEVKLQYNHVLEGHNQQLGSDGRSELPVLYGRGRCSIVEKSTNFYRPYGDPDAPRTAIQVAHTFPSWENGIAATTHDPDYPRTIFQGGEINIPFPQANNGFLCLVTTQSPYMLARRIIRHINSVPWQGEPELTWLCTEVGWEINGRRQDALSPLGLTQYKMNFEFQFNADGWDPLVVFNDNRTGRPPANVEYAVGTTTISYTDSAGNPINAVVLDLTRNPVTLGTQPAGAWNVPALPRLDIAAFFAAVVDGFI